MAGISKFLKCDGAEIHFMEWGDPQGEAVVMWHGLARTGRDFDDLAEALSDQWRVICPDTLGRGMSQWAEHREQQYSFASYCRCALDLLNQLGVEKVRWIGTSMGGMIGVVLAANDLRERMTHMVLNDIGPGAIPDEAIQRIAEYVGNPPVFETIGELEQWLRSVYAPFGKNPDSFWQRMAETSYRRTDDGHVTVHYDPMIVTQFTTHKSDLDLWEEYDQVKCLTLLMRGADSDVLPVEVATEMSTRGPCARLEVFEGYGHAPTLNTPEQIALLRDFFHLQP